MAENIYDFSIEDINGKDINMSNYQCCVVIIVNVASESEHAEKNYSQLQELYEKFGDRGLRIIGFPCNQFDSQEPKSNAAIRVFAKKRGVTFDMAAKIDVNGDDAIPLFTFLKAHENTNGEITGNFTKFFVDRQGTPRYRFGEYAEPNETIDFLRELIEE